MTDETTEDPVDTSAPEPEAQADAPADKTAETLLTASDDDIKVAAPADWPEDWRARLAGDDAKDAKKLERYKSPQEIFKAYRALEAKMSSGEVSTKLPKDATDEQVAEYRKANGIPDKPEGYLDALPDGLVIGDDDKALVQSYLERVHGKNADPAIVSEALSWYYDLQEEMAAETAKVDKQRQLDAADELRAEWGGEFRSNMNSIKAFLDTAPVGEDGTPLSELLLTGRLGNGVPLGDSPDALRWLAKLADEANPAGFVPPAAGGSQAESIDSEIAQIEKTMREDRKTYDKDTKMQERLLKLYEAQGKLATRAA